VLVSWESREAGLNTFDLILLGFACLLVVAGMIKGLVRILVGLAALMAAFALAARFHEGLAARLSGLDLSLEVLRLVAYLMIFLGVMLAGGAVAYLTRRLLRAAMLSWADRLGGAALGLVAAMLAAALLVLPIVAYSPYGERMLGASVLAPYVTVVAEIATGLVPDDLKARYREKVEDLRRYWQDRYDPPRTEPPRV
jgi:membrane protein required for colicin V production